MAIGDGGRILINVDPDLRDLLPGYLANRGKDIETVTAALERGDFELIGCTGHNLLGSGRSYGLDEVTAIGVDIERAAKTADRGEIVRQLRRLEDYLSRIDDPGAGPSAAWTAACVAPRPAEGNMGAGSGATEILLVDDQEMNIAIISRYLTREGYRVKSCASGEAALAALAAPPPALILLDVVMPGASGLEICRRIKSDPATRGVPVVLVTSVENERDRIQAWAAGADDLLAKPVRRADLVNRVRLLLRPGRRAGDSTGVAHRDDEAGAAPEERPDHGTTGVSG